jgi:hypothetical protein
VRRAPPPDVGNHSGIPDDIEEGIVAVTAGDPQTDGTETAGVGNIDEIRRLHVRETEAAQCEYIRRWHATSLVKRQRAANHRRPPR